MKALFVYSNKYERYDDCYYSITQTANVWKERYLPVFDKLTVIGRVVDVAHPSEKALSNCDRVSFACTKMGLNAIDYILKKKRIVQYIDDLVSKSDFIIARQSFFGAIAAECARKRGKPYVVEVVGSSWDANWNYSLKGKLVAPYFELQARSMIRKAKYVIFVTNQYLQKIYPTKGRTIGISNVEISSSDDSVIKGRISKIKSKEDKAFSVCTVAAIDVKYKGHRFVLKAMSKLIKKGYNIKYYIVGGGSKKSLLNIARKLDLEDRIIFTGAIKHDDVLRTLDRVDLYIQPSLQEGLPRAMIEAMSRGLPCIGYKTAGIPELIGKKYVLRRKSVGGICSLIQAMSKEEMIQMANTNFEKSKEYSFEILNAKRISFLKEASDAK